MSTLLPGGQPKCSLDSTVSPYSWWRWLTARSQVNPIWRGGPRLSACCCGLVGETGATLLPGLEEIPLASVRLDRVARPLCRHPSAAACVTGVAGVDGILFQRERRILETGNEAGSVFSGPATHRTARTNARQRQGPGELSGGCGGRREPGPEPLQFFMRSSGGEIPGWRLIGVKVILRQLTFIFPSPACLSLTCITGPT